MSDVSSAPSKPPFTIVIPGEMRGKGRPRFARGGKFVRVYTDKATENAETWIRNCALEQVGQPCLTGALAIQIAVSTAVPASWSKRKQAEALANLIHPTGKPDFDNLGKTLGDALNGIVWKDDSQIVHAQIRKFYAAVPETVLTVRAL